MIVKGKAPRWYSWFNGIVEPCYELAKKSGNGMKAYTLREARELKLLPSVTSVLSVIDKPELDNWRVSQAIHSALTLPRERIDLDAWFDMAIKDLASHGSNYSPDYVLSYAYHNPPPLAESEDAFAERVLADAEAQANKAAEFGTRIHDAIADWLENFKDHQEDSKDRKERYIHQEFLPYLEGFMHWANENIEEVHSVERCVGHPYIGVAGRMDLDCTLKGVGRAICDMKTQEIRDGKPKYWDDWVSQLSAYAECSHDGPNHRVGSLQWRLVPRIMSVVIPSNEPGPIHTRLWTEEEQANGWEIFQAAFTIWRLRRNYDPRQP